MRIATPPGYSSRPSRRVWPIVLGAALLLGIGGGIAVTRANRGAGDPDGAGSGTEGGAPGSAVDRGPGSAVATVAVDAGRTPEPPPSPSPSPGAGSQVPARPRVAPPARSAHLSIDSAPSGAKVTGPNGELLGTTPLKIDWPISDRPVTFELVLGGYHRKQNQAVINGNTALHVELERISTSRRGGKPSGGANNARGGSAKPSNGLMHPDE